MKKILLFILIYLFALASVSFAAPVQNIKEATKNFGFMSSDSLNFSYSNGFGLTFNFPYPGLLFDYEGDAYYSFKEVSGVTMEYTASLIGTECTFQNTSNQVLIIKWGESSISCGNLSGVPFLDGMKYSQAGNPSATPDTILAPGQAVTKDVYFPNVEFSRDWRILGVPVPRTNDLQVTLVLKIIDGQGSAQYVTAKTPLIGVKGQ